MGVDIADMNNDMLYDIFTLDMMPFYNDVFLKSGGEDSDQVYKIKNSFGYGDQYARNNFHLNRGNSKFSDIAIYTETYATDWSWSVLLEDLNLSNSELIRLMPSFQRHFHLIYGHRSQMLFLKHKYLNLNLIVLI